MAQLLSADARAELEAPREQLELRLAEAELRSDEALRRRGDNADGRERVLTCGHGDVP
jgi:hypothetical protein